MKIFSSYMRIYFSCFLGGFKSVLFLLFAFQKLHFPPRYLFIHNKFHEFFRLVGLPYFREENAYMALDSFNDSSSI